MRFVAIVVTCLLPAFASTVAKAAVPNAVAVLLGPSVGYLLAQSDLCQWGLGEKIEKTTKLASKQSV